MALLNQYKLYLNGNNCPICNLTNKGCKLDQLSPDKIVLCRKADEYTEVPGYISLCPTENGTWQMFKIGERTAPLSYEEKKRYAIEKQERDQRAQAEHDRMMALLPSKLQKHNDILDRIKKNPLSQEYVEYLRKERNLTDEEIKSRGYFNHFDGIAIPFMGLEGLYLGFQVKQMRPGVKGYKWGFLTGQNHLSETGQLPIAVAGETANPKGILMAEGLGFMIGYIAKHFPEYLVLGAASGNFAVSWKQTKSILNQFPDIPVYLMPDGGSHKNTTVFPNYKRTHDKCKTELNREVKLWWWGQLEKGTDIDEISLDTKITHITFAKFESFRDTTDILPQLKAFAKNTFRRILSKKTQPLFRKTEFGRDSVDHYYKASRTASYEYGDDPIYDYDASDMEAVVNRAKRAGAILLDISHAGMGKSTTASLMRILDYKKVIFVSQNYRNPSTIEAYLPFLFPSRVEYYYDIHDRIMPNGEPYVATSEPESGAYTKRAGNCPKAKEFHSRTAKGYESESHQICFRCPFQDKCEQAPIDENDVNPHYLYERKQAFSQNRIRMSPASFCMFNAADLKDALVIFDDCKPVRQKELVATQQDILLTMKDILLKDATLHARLAPLFSVIMGLSEEVSTHGFEHKEILERLSDVGFEPSIMDVPGIVGATTPDLFKVKLDEVAPNWLSWLYEVLLFKVHGVIRMVKDRLIITHRDDSHVNLLQHCTTLVLDATQTRAKLALEMSVEVDDISVMSQEDPEYQNLFFHLLRGAGTPVKGRRIDNVHEVAKAIEALHGKMSVLDKKGMEDKSNPLDIRAVQFRDNRGSNAFKEDKVILSVGLHCINMGAVADMYSILSGEIVSASEEHIGFREYLRSLNAAEEIQAVGRLRANRRSDEVLHYYLWADSSNVPLEEIMAAHPGATLVEDQMINIYPKAASKVERLKLAIMGCIQRLPGLTQKELATITNSSVSSISRLCKEFGGYKKTCQSLLEISIELDKFLNSEKIDWNTLLPTGIAEYTSNLLDDGTAAHETALEIEKIVEPLTQDQKGTLLAAIGKTKATLLVEHLFYLQLHRDIKMKLSKNGESIEEIVEGLRSIAQRADMDGLELLRAAHADDKEALQYAASVVKKECEGEFEILKDLTIMANKVNALRLAREAV